MIGTCAVILIVGESVDPMNPVERLGKCVNPVQYSDERLGECVNPVL